MPSTAFVDSRVQDELEKIYKANKTNIDSESKENVFPEHDFLATCLKIGLTIFDLKILTYVDVLKIFISFCTENEKTGNTEKNGVREATPEDIKNIVARL